MPSYLVTGAGRGIGLGMVEELLKDPNNFVIAAARNPAGAKGLQELVPKFSKERLALVTLDYADTSSIEKAATEASELLPDGLDYLISNAGTSSQASATLDDVDLKVFEEELRINTVAPIHLVRTFLPLIRKGNAKKVVLVTSNLGSVELAVHTATLAITYSITKAGLNILARKWGATLSTEGIAIVLIHPGWADTEMGHSINDWVEANAPGRKKVSVQTSVTGCLKVITKATPEKSIKFYNYDGSTISW